MNLSAKKMFFIDLLITIIGVLFDQFTKHLAVLRLKDQAPVSLIPGALELRYLENRGAAFGILQNQKIQMQKADGQRIILKMVQKRILHEKHINNCTKNLEVYR